ncbi:MAG: hypothetical protein DPW16_10985 [Chloroflexi bacterium]|nr:hypothetical protein [Chloroflexota bacterium]
MKVIKEFFAPTIQYSLVVMGSPENCLRKIQSGLPLKPKETYSQRFLEQNQYFKIATDKFGDPQFEVLVRRVDPGIIGSMVITGRFSPLDSQRTLVFGEVRSWAFCFLIFMLVVVSLFMFAALCNNSLIGLLIGLIIVPVVVYFNLARQKVASSLIDALKQALES